MVNKSDLVVGLSILIVLVVISIVHDEELEYKNTLTTIGKYKNICESAGLTFEEVGHLKSPEEQKQEGYMTYNYVRLRCFELKNNIKVYYDLRNMELV